MEEYNVARVETGIQGLDEMLGGGIPEKSIILLCGGPGSGKTIMTLQYMMRAVSRGEPVVYVSLEESMEKKTKNALAFGWDLVDAEANDMIETLDIYMVPHSQGVVEPIERRKGKIQFSIENEIETAVKRLGAKHIIIDPVTSILVHESRSGKKRYLIGQLFDTIRNLGCSAVITSEGLPSVGDFYMEQFLSDGVFLLNKDLIDYTMIKTIRIDKMRGINFDDQPRRYIINNRGFQVFSSEPVLV
ncbi:MAG: AAA family ATPase [Candidatus Bathyarchaeota archaeon]|nr:AAA family ATPase [Candidatus Bathyarchaeota archaeon]